MNEGRFCSGPHCPAVESGAYATGTAGDFWGSTAVHEPKGGLRIAERPADREDREPEPGEEEGDPDHDPEQADLRSQLAHVERTRERGLADPDLPGAVLHRLLRRRIDCGELAVARTAAVSSWDFGVPGFAW